jgi:TRAP-type C4-dicarboxylate transport system substrate-binding protein
MKCNLLAAGVGAVLLATAAALPAQAQDKTVELKFSYWVPPVHPLVPSTQQWADDVAKASNGSIKITIFPSEQLGKAFDHYDMARDGIADLTYVSPGYQPGRFPLFAGAGLPFVLTNANGGSRAVDEWYRKYASREMKDVHFCLAFVHDPGAFHSKKKIVMPEDLKGMKVRPATGTIAALVSSLGGTNVQASAPEARDVLERGVADAITFPWRSMFLFHIETAVKYHMDVPLYTTPFVWVMNQGKYNALSAAQKKVIDDHCTTDWAEKVAAPWGDFEASGRDMMKKLAGHEVYSLTADQLAAWKKAAAPLRTQWDNDVKKLGLDPATVMGELEADLKKDKAAY